MYEHGFATLFLAEVYGMSPRDDLARQADPGGRSHRANAKRRGRVAVSAAARGCGYLGDDLPGDGAAGGTNAGLRVPNETVDRCVDYVKKCQNADGGFRYMLQAPAKVRFRVRRRVSWRCTARACTKGPEIERGLGVPRSICPRAERPWQDGHFFYGHYYACRRCGRPAANGGSAGIRRCAMCSSPASSRMGRGPIRFVRNTARRWRRSFCRCRIIVCRFFSDEAIGGKCYARIQGHKEHGSDPCKSSCLAVSFCVFSVACVPGYLLCGYRLNALQTRGAG